MDRTILNCCANPFQQRPWLRNVCAASANTKETKRLRSVVAGGITGGLEICITYPIEFVKTQLQLNKKGEQNKYNGIFDCLKKTIKDRGVLGLYRGLSVLLIGNMPKMAIRFGAYEFLKDLFIDEKGHMSTYGNLFAGLGAGACEAVVVVTPTETIKVKLINDQRSDTPRFKGLIHGITQISQTEGIRGLYKGVIATILRQGTNQGVQFFTVETLKDIYKGDNRDKNVPKFMIGIFGLIAGVASVLSNGPIDVIKTRMQSLEGNQYKSTADCFSKIWKNEGIRGFYRGTLARLSRIPISVATTFMIYNSVMDLLAQVWP